jgi:hypothetical protein
MADHMDARVEMVDRISSLDLRTLGVGEAYITWHDQYFKAKLFHAFPEGEYEDLSFGRPDAPPTDPARIEAQRSGVPSTMRKVEHGVTVDGRETFRMAEKLQNNDATLRFLAALNFDADEGAEPGVEVVDTAIEKAVIFDDEDDLPPAQTADPVEIERADVASARATQWTDRAGKGAPRSREPVPDLETAVRSGNVEDMTASFLADLMEDKD